MRRPASGVFSASARSGLVASIRIASGMAASALMVSGVFFAVPAHATTPCQVSTGFVQDAVTYDLAADCTAMVMTGTPVAGKVSIPNPLTTAQGTYSVTEIGISAFENAITLTSLELPSSLTSIDEFAFAHTGLSGALDLSFLTSLTTMLRRAFSFNGGLTSVILPSSLTTIGNSFFWDTNITSATFRGPLPLTNSGALFPLAAIIHYCGPDSSPWHSYTVVPECSRAFATGGGSVVPLQTILYGASFDSPNSPTRSGYTFSGWFTTAGAVAPFDFSALATSNSTAYAGWVADAVPSQPELAATGFEASTLTAVGGLLLVLGMGAWAVVARSQRRRATAIR